MNKRDALKLRPGERICFGNSMWSAKVARWRFGTVVSVTPNGGVRVRVESADKAHLEWVPYHYIHQGAG